MTLQEFLQHTKINGCEHEPIVGRNLTGIGIKITHKGNNTSYHLQIYKGGHPSDKTIKEACDILFIRWPDYLQET